MLEQKNLDISLLEVNKGQLYGLPKNPRFIKDDRYLALKKSIEEAPEMLSIREIVVYPLENGHYVVIGGNMRLRACQEIGYKELPCKILPLETPVAKLREYTIKDNIAFGSNDWDVIANEWDTEELSEWGMELPDFAVDDTPIEPEENKDETQYSRNIEIPTYQITGAEPTIAECVDVSAVKKLIKQIDESNVSEEQKEMLRICAYRHAVIHFDNIAEYYAHQDKEMQNLMEENALVIIDFDRAIEKGFVDMTDKLLRLIPNKDESEILDETEMLEGYDEE